MTVVFRSLAGCALAVLALATAPSSAHAWWRGGVFVGIPPVAPYYYGYYGPRYYVPPPVIYAPPPAVYAPQPPPAYVQPGQACYAGAYVCPLDAPAPAGAPCSCPTNTGRAGGRVG